MSFEINLILYFVAVAEELSFRKAANKLHIAQPWLSRQIRNLEYQLGYDLFVRSTRHVELTDKGRRLLEKARRVADEVSETRKFARELSEEQPDHLRFGLPYYGIYVRERMELFDQFSAKYPRIRLDVSIGNLKEMMENLDSGHIDVLFRTGGKKDLVGFDVVTLCEGKLNILVSEKDPLAKRDVVRFSDLRNHGIAGFPRELAEEFFELLFGPFEEQGFEITAFPDYTFPRRLDELGMVTVLPSWAPIPAPGIVRRPVVGLDRTLKFEIVRRRDEQSAPLDRFWKMAEQYVAATKDSVHA